MARARTGTIVSFDGSQGVIRLDDRSELVFFRFSFDSITPAVGMAVQVRKSEPFYKGGLRATDVSVVGQRIDPRAPKDRSWAVDHWRVERAREREAIEAERLQAGEAVDAFEARWDRRNRLPEPLSLEAVFGGAVPSLVTAFIERTRDLGSFSPTFAARADPAFVAVLDASGSSLGFTSHPELPLELGLLSHGSLCELTLPAESADTVVELLEHRVRKARLTKVFARRARPRSDGTLVSAWLSVAETASVEHSARKDRDEHGAVLLDFYQERQWSLLAARLQQIIEGIAHLDRREDAKVAFLTRHRGKTISARAVDELLPRAESK